MHLVDCYIIEIHEEKDSIYEGIVTVDVTIDFCGRVYRTEHTTTKKQWEIDKKNGFFLG